MNSVNSKETIAQKKVILVDDHPVMREGFARFIDDEADLFVCAQFGEARGVLEGIAEHHPDLIIVDICLDDVPGLELIKDISALHPALPILALSMYEESLYAERAIRAGASGYVMKRCDAETVIQAVRQVLSGELWLGDGVRNKLINKFLKGAPSSDACSEVDTLSDRELEVLQLLGGGMKVRDIAGKLGISPKTVETHRAHLKEKLGMKDSTELMRFAVQWVDRI